MTNENSLATFLLVEDDEVDVMNVQRVMKRQGLSNPLLIANDGAEALSILRGDDPAKPKPTKVIVLLDINMPRMNGHEFLKHLRDDKRLAPLVVFVLTSSNLERDLHQAYERHVAGYILKEDIDQGGLTQALCMLDQYWRVVELPKIP